MEGQIKDSIFTLTRQVLVMILGLAIFPIITRMLGVEGFGQYNTILALIAIFGLVAGMGLEPAILYYRGKGKLSDTGKDVVIWKTIFIGLTISGSFLLVIGYFWPGLMEGVLKIELFIIIALYILALTLKLPAHTILSGKKRFLELGLLQVINRFILLAVLAVFYLLESNSLTVVLWIMLFVELTNVLAHWWLKLRNNGKYNFEAVESEVSGKDLRRFGFKTLGGNIVATLSYRVDVLMLGALASVSEVGIYGIAVLIAEKVWLVSRSVSTVSLAYLTDSDEYSGDKQRVHQACVSAKWVGIATALICLCLVPFLFFIPIIFGSGFEGAKTMVLILFPGMVVCAGTRILANMITALGRPGANLIVGLSGLLVNVLLNWWLCPIYGGQGAALATTISYSTVCMIRLVFIKCSGFSLKGLYVIKTEEWLIIKSFIAKLRVAVLGGKFKRS